MGILDFLRQKTTEEAVLPTPIEPSIIEENEVKPKISKDMFVNDEQPQTEQYPIYEIYNILSSDMETMGYKDAVEYPDSSYINTKQELIVRDIKMRIQIARRKYNDMIADISHIIESYKKMGLVESLCEQMAEHKKLLEHLEELSKIEQEINENGECIKHLLISYKQGFQRGLVMSKK